MNGLYLQDFLRPHTSGEVCVRPSEKNNPHTPHIAPLLLTESSTTCSVTPPRPTESPATGDQRTLDHADEGVDVNPASNVDVEVKFPRSSHVTRTSSIETPFLVNEEIIPIKIENI